MQIKLSEYRPTPYGEIGEYSIDYEFDGEVVTATYDDGEQTITDEFDFSTLAEDEKLVDVNTDIPVKVIKSAKRVDGEVQVVLMKPYNMNKKERIEKYGYGNLPFSIDWQVV